MDELKNRFELEITQLVSKIEEQTCLGNDVAFLRTQLENLHGLKDELLVARGREIFNQQLFTKKRYSPPQRVGFLSQLISTLILNIRSSATIPNTHQPNIHTA